MCLMSMCHFHCTIVSFSSKCFIFIILSCFFASPGTAWALEAHQVPGPGLGSGPGLGPGRDRARPGPGPVPDLGPNEAAVITWL